MKTIYRLKVILLLGLSIIILCIIAYGSLSPNKRVSESIQPIINDTLFYPTQCHVSLRDSLVDFGISFLDTPYVPGGCSKAGFDCSGFVYFVFQQFNVQVPRSSSQYKNFGKEISIDSVQKGDVLVFLSPTSNVLGHVGIVSNPNGMESDFMHATSGKEMKVVITSLKKSGYQRRFVKAVNVF
ncbi:MAG: C40 family peptidase [Prolixibacteraceae bacterium]